MKIPYFCCIGAELKRYAKDFDFMNQVYLYKVPADDTMEEVLAQDYFQAVADTVLQDDIVYIYEPTTEMLYTCHFNKQNGHITAEQMSNNIPSLTPDKILISDATGHITAGDVSLDFVKNKLTDLENDKVNIDGSSTMTGPLKFKAGSFSGAIAGGLGDGISIYKLKADGTIDSEVASLTKTNGFTPGTTNAQNIGSPTLKWKDAHIARVITSVINNGHDIAVPVTNSADTLALKSEVDNAANSGRMITDTGVWYAKMYSASTVPTGAEYDGKNYADFSQTDGEGNPVIKIYTGASGAWTLTDTITPPANYDGYVPVTKKIWDIVEQTGQQGGRVLWNHQSKEFTPYPNIVDLSNVATTNLDNLTPTGEAKFTAKANTDMDNLTSTGQNIANWSSNVSNCITKIPQDIKLELNNGTLTLKAGSKVYVPNGPGVFDEITIINDVSDIPSMGTATALLFVSANVTSLQWRVVSNCGSGTTDAGTSGTTFYNTSSNQIVSHNIGGDVQVSFPLAIISSSNGTITSINQVFNGFGYIGSSAFVLPGVKGLIPNRRNADGTLKSTEISTTEVQVVIPDTPLSLDVGIILEPQSRKISYIGGYYYDEKQNINLDSGVERPCCYVGSCTLTNSVISNFKINSVFHAVDYNEADFVVDFQRPTAANNYVWYRKYKSGWVEQGCAAAQTGGNGVQVTFPIPLNTSNDYNVTLTMLNNDTSNVPYILCYYDQQSTGIKVTSRYANSVVARDFNWMVCGIAAN